MRHALLIGSICFLVACGGGQKAAESPSSQAELDAAKAEISQLKDELAKHKEATLEKPSTAMNTEAINSVYEMQIAPEHLAAYLKSGQEFAEKARGIEGVLHYVLLKHPSKPNTVIWIERFANEAGKANYAEKSGVKEAQAATKHMIKGMSYILSGAHEANE